MPGAKNCFIVSVADFRVATMGMIFSGGNGRKRWWWMLTASCDAVF
jgi:hypothetical protein